MPTETTRRPRGSGNLTQVSRSPGGPKMWVGRWWDANGVRVKRTIGPVRIDRSGKGLTQTQAEARLRELIVMTKPEASGSASEALTVDQVALALLVRMGTRGRSPRTLADFENARTNHFGKLAERPAADVTRSEVDRWVAALVASGLKPKTVLNVRGHLHATFALALREGWVTVNPVAGSERPSVPRSTGIRFLEPEEVEAVVRAIPDDEWADLERDLYRVAAFTGLRQGELLELRGRDVDLSAEVVRAERKVLGGVVSETKGRAVRSVPMAPQVQRILAARLLRHDVGPNDLVFESPTGGHHSRFALGQRFAVVVEKADVPRVTFHELRHTFGTLAARGGVDVNTIRAWMGHTEIQTTMVYLHYAPQPGASATLGRAFSGTQTGPKVPDTEGYIKVE